MSDINTVIDQVVLDPYKNDVFTVAFFALALLLSTVWRNFLIVFVHKIREMILSHDWRTFQAENANSGPRLQLSLAILYIGVSSIYIYQVIAYSERGDIPFWHIGLVVFCVHFTRLVLTKFIERVFNLKDVYEIWIESYTWVHYILGVALFPLAVLITYSPESTFSICTNLALVFFLLCEILFFYRLLTVFYHSIASFFYLFLYLCTLELLPLLIVYRILF